MAITYSSVANSSFVDLTSYRITDATTAAAAYGFHDGQAFANESGYGFNVALVLPRANDPTALLAGDWASRQDALKTLNDAGTLWTTYGADKATYDAAVALIKNDLGLKVLDGSNSNYVTSADSRTIWVEVGTQADFQKLFDIELRFSPSQGQLFWNGELKLPSALTVAGLWFDTSTSPPGANLTPGVSTTLQPGAQSLGNTSSHPANLPPQQIATLYDFPLDGATTQTKAVGLIEPGIGTALQHDPTGANFGTLLQDYLAAIGTSGDGTVTVDRPAGQSYDNSALERSLDVSVAAAINPNSDLVLFNGSGFNAYAQASVYTALQAAVFPSAGVPQVSVFSDSFGDAQSMAPNSPFYRAYWELYVDTVLANQTAVTALGDGGSGDQTGNGLTNVEYNATQPYNLLVGGTSLSSLHSSRTDTTLSTAVVAPAMSGDLDMIWQLVIGGLTVLPSNLTGSQLLVETAWNYYIVNGAEITGPPGDGSGYLTNTTTSGGVDPTQPVPDYQVAYGLNPTTSDPLAQVGRGAPDVTANAGGNTTYRVASDTMLEYDWDDFGTSAAAPLWASLIAQINTIFADQGLPDLGYAHDLLYAAAAIAPAAFNDVTMGNNTSSFVYGGSYTTPNGNGHLVAVTPTGFGYYAGPGYDLVSGLGSPNGTFLARTLSAEAHAQTYFADVPHTIVGSEAAGWTSGAAQSLLFQTMAGSSVTVDVTLGSGSFSWTSNASDTYAWTSRLAMQSLNPNFDPALVQLFDKQGQGAQEQRYVAAGMALDVSIDGVDAQAIQAGLTSAYGFADFMSSDGVVRVARPVAVAETAGGADDQQAVVRMRQNGQDTLSVSFYKVDDYAGTINGLQPGEVGYGAAANARAYQVLSGSTTSASLAGPGYGNYTQAMLQGVDAGDLVAMKLSNVTSGHILWGFALANETVDGQSVGHLWNYGLNTWGWEDTRGGGDHDYNDLIVQLDFTSASGSGWLV